MKKRKKEGERQPKRPQGGPVDLSQAEVEGLIAERPEARREWKARVVAAAPSDVPVGGAAKTPKASPPRVTRGEMELIAKGGLPEAVRSRLQRGTRPSEPPGEAPAEVPYSRGETPERRPPDGTEAAE